jgi:hypothetical protein
MVALCLVSMTTVLLVGCGPDRRPIVIGSGVVTAGSGRSAESTSTSPATPTAGSNDGTATPTAGSSDSTATPTPGSNDGTATPSEDSSEPPAGCGPVPGSQESGGGARAVPTPFRDDEAELDVDGQSGDGRTVFVAEVQLARKDGFVAVCSLDDLLLGSRAIARSNDERSVRVTLDEPITRTIQLLVVLYADNGDGHFDWETDPRVSGDDDDITDLEVERLTYRYAA